MEMVEGWELVEMENGFRSLKGKGLKDIGTHDKITVKRPTWVKGEMG